MTSVEFAKLYLEKGLSIIPVRSLRYSRKEDDFKTPLVKWADFQLRYPSVEEIHEWFSRYPEAGIAIVTGKLSGIVVVDFDSEKAIKWAEERELLNTACVRTRRGIHAYYRYPQGREIRNSVNVQGMRIDIRAEGGYVVAPPTAYPGGVYEWLKPLDLIAELPEIFIIQNTGTTVTKIADIARGVEQGRRNSSLASYAGHLFSMGFSFQDVLQACLIWNGRNTPPLDEKEVERTVQSIYRTHIRNLVSVAYYEKNLARYPLFVYSKDLIHTHNEIVYIEDPLEYNNKKIERHWKVVPGKYGLPGPFDEAVFLAVFKIIYEKYGPSFRNPADVGSLRNICRFLNIDDNSGENRREVAVSLLRLKTLTVISENLYYSAERNSFITDYFSVFDRVKFYGEASSNTKEARTIYLWVNPVVAKNFQHGFAVRIDWNVFLKLPGIARGLYRLLSAYDFNKSITFSYSKLAKKLQIKEYASIPEIKKQLTPALRQLHNIAGIQYKIIPHHNTVYFEFYK